jgi:arabinofuranosyltransferase
MPKSWRAWLVALAATVATAGGAELVTARHTLGPVDDAFISLRYAANWAGGRGLCFNPRESVEGYSNFLLVLIEAAAIRGGADPVLAMTLIGRVSFALLGGLIAAFAYAHLFPQRAVPAVLAGVLAALNPVLICWGFSGMESSLLALLLFAALATALAATNITWAVLSAMCLVLAAMTRLEVVVLFPVIPVVLYLQGRSRRLAITHAVVLFVAFGAYFAARAIHFGYLFPNTFYAKLDYGNLLLARRGALYIWDFVCASPLLFLLPAGALWLGRPAPLWVRAALLVVALQLAGVVYEGGDHFAMFRFMVPVVPFLTLLALYPAAALVRSPGLLRIPGWPAVVVSLAAIGASDLLVGRPLKRNELRPTTQFARFVAECASARQWADLGRWFQETAPPDASLTTIAIGAIGYYSGLAIVDPLGLVNPGIAHLGQPLGGDYAGHEKHDVAQVLARRPSYILAIHVLTPKPVPASALSEATWGKLNQELARDPAVYREYRYEVIQFGTRYLNLFVRQDLPTPGVPAP